MSSSQALTCPAPRTRRACNRCRALKTRCLASEHPTICRRCLARHHDCVYATSQENRQTAVVSAKRQYGTISQRQPLTPVSSDDGTQHNIPELGFGVERPPDQTTARDASTETEALGFMHRSMLRRHFNKDSEHLISPSSTLSNDEDNLSRRDTRNSMMLHSSPPRLGDAEVEQYLYKYERLFHYFPFLPLPPGWSVNSMRTDHPFFLLGIISAMTIHDVEINAQVHSQFLRVLAERAVVRGEKSLDIVQGIIVQLAWFPMHLNPSGRQIFQIVQMASTMTVDLGLDKAIKLADSELKPIAHNTSDTDAMSPSIRRTHAACCHISSVIAVSFHRKNNFSYPGKLDRHYTPALQGGDDPADNLIFVHIKLQQLVEQAETGSKNRQLDALGAATIVDTLTNELYAIFEAMRKEVREQSPIRLAKHFVQLQIQSVALAELRPSAAAPVDSNDVQDWRHATLLRCLESSKAYFETFLSLPVSEYRNMAFADKGRLVLTLTILAKLCFDISGFPRWDSAWARKEVHFGMIIESLCYRMTELTCTGKSQSLYDAALPPDHFFMMKSVLQIVKEVYDEAVAEALDNSEEEQAKRKKASRCPVLNGELMNTDFWEALEHSHESGLDPLLDGNWNLNDSNTWDWDWDWSATI